jgi:hypothetical protein
LRDAPPALSLALRSAYRNGMMETTIDRFRDAIVRVFPQLSGSTFKLMERGWDCFAVDVDGRLICKFPRHAEGESRLVMQVKLLAVIRPRVSLPLPDMHLHAGPPLFSSHAKLIGEHVVTAEYDALLEAAKKRLGDDLGRFYGELHRIDQAALVEAGAKPIKPWKTSAEIHAKVIPILSPELRDFAQETLAGRNALAADPYGESYGFLDGHGWNMAFDHAQERLNGLYDFGDSGIAPLHQEFIYSSMISADLTERIVTAYESFTGRNLDRRRVDVLTGTHRLWELAEWADDPANRQLAIDNVAKWAITMRSARG